MVVLALRLRDAALGRELFAQTRQSPEKTQFVENPGEVWTAFVKDLFAKRLPKLFSDASGLSYGGHMISKAAITHVLVETDCDPAVLQRAHEEDIDAAHVHLRT
jgi:hypothetical protein